MNRRFFLNLLPAAGALFGLKAKRQTPSAKLPNLPGYQFHRNAFAFVAPPLSPEELDACVRRINEMQAEIIELAPRAPWVGYYYEDGPQVTLWTEPLPDHHMVGVAFIDEISMTEFQRRYPSERIHEE